MRRKRGERERNNFDFACVGGERDNSKNAQACNIDILLMEWMLPF